MKYNVLNANERKYVLLDKRNYSRYFTTSQVATYLTYESRYAEEFTLQELRKFFKKNPTGPLY